MTITGLCMQPGYLTTKVWDVANLLYSARYKEAAALARTMRAGARACPQRHIRCRPHPFLLTTFFDDPDTQHTPPCGANVSRSVRFARYMSDVRQLFAALSCTPELSEFIKCLHSMPASPGIRRIRCMVARPLIEACIVKKTTSLSDLMTVANWCSVQAFTHETHHLICRRLHIDGALRHQPAKRALRLQYAGVVTFLQGMVMRAVCANNTHPLTIRSLKASGYPHSISAIGEVLANLEPAYAPGLGAIIAGYSESYDLTAFGLGESLI